MPNAEVAEYVDVHNHVMPAEVLDLLRREPAYGVTIDGDRWYE